MSSDQTQTSIAGLGLSALVIEATKVMTSIREDENDAFNPSNGNASRHAKKDKTAEISWGATEDLIYAAQIVDSVVKQVTGEMDEAKGGHWKLWVTWLQASLFTFARAFKNGKFQNIKPSDKINKVFNIIIGSSLSTAAEKEILRRGLKIFSEIKSRYENGGTKLTQFHSILMSGIYINKIFLIFHDGGGGHKATTYPGADWSFSWRDKNGKVETYRVDQGWMIFRSPGFRMPKVKQLHEAAGVGGDRQSKVATTTGKKGQQGRKGRKRENLPPSPQPETTWSTTATKAGVDESVIRKLMNDPITAAIMKRPGGEEWVRMTLQDLSDTTKKMQKEIGRKPTPVEAMAKVCMKTIVEDLKFLAVEPGMAEHLEKAAADMGIQIAAVRIGTPGGSATPSSV